MISRIQGNPIKGGMTILNKRSLDREFPMFYKPPLFFSLFLVIRLFWHPKHVTTQICHRYQTPVDTQKVVTLCSHSDHWIRLMFLTAMIFLGEKFELCTKKCLQKCDFLDSIHLLLGVNHLGKFLASRKLCNVRSIVSDHSFPTLIRPYILNRFISKGGVRQLGGVGWRSS